MLHAWVPSELLVDAWRIVERNMQRGRACSIDPAGVIARGTAISRRVLIVTPRIVTEIVVVLSSMIGRRKVRYIWYCYLPIKDIFLNRTISVVCCHPIPSMKRSDRCLEGAMVSGDRVRPKSNGLCWFDYSEVELECLTLFTSRLLRK